MVQQTHSTLQQSALKSVYKHLTIRNWLVGFYIVEFEQNGEDRATYGEKLVDELATSIDIKGISTRNLKLFRQFYFFYPEIVQTVTAQLKNMGIENTLPIYQLPTDELQLVKNQSLVIGQSATDELQNHESQQLRIVHLQNAQFNRLFRICNLYAYRRICKQGIVLLHANNFCCTYE